MAQNERLRRTLPVEPVEIFIESAEPTQGTTQNPGVASAAPGGGPTTGQQEKTQGSSWRERARGYFGPEAQERMRRRYEQRRSDEEKITTDDPNADTTAQLLQLRAASRKAGEDYITSLREAKFFVPGFSGEPTTQIDARHKVYMQMMLQSCMRPLSRGVNTRAVVQAVGMLMAMRMLSPDFKEHAAGLSTKVRSVIDNRMDARVQARLGAAEQGIAQRQELFGNVSNERTKERLVGSTDSRDYLSKTWRKRYDAMQRRERGDRELFTTESAAMTEIGLMENAYEQMQAAPGQSQEIYKNYLKVRNRVRDQFDQDGLDQNDVTMQMNLSIGERLEHQPEFGSMFSGLAYGQVRKAPAREVLSRDGSGVRSVWVGDFETVNGSPVAGRLRLRAPMTADEHQYALSQAMKSSMVDSLALEGQKGFEETVVGYVAGFASSRQGLDPRGLPPVLHARILQSETMVATLAVDGISEDEQRRVFSNAYVDAIEQLGTEVPGMEQRIEAVLGANWQTMLNMARDPEGFYEQQRADESSPNASHQRRTSSAHFEEPAAADDEYQPA